MVRLRMTTPAKMHAAALRCHPETYSQDVRGVEASVWWTEDGALALTYTLKGSMARLRIPPLQPPRRADHLWEHACFEAFVSVKDKSAYYEFNFAPSGEWAAYGFRGYRNGAPLEDEDLTSKISARGTPNSLVLDATVRLDRLPMIQSSAPLLLALSAVIEGNDGVLSYWALRHPPGKPDFHHHDAFALEIEAPQVAAANDPAYTGKA
jgi:hypothetical protein